LNQQSSESNSFLRRCFFARFCWNYFDGSLLVASSTEQKEAPVRRGIHDGTEVGWPYLQVNIKDIWLREPVCRWVYRWAGYRAGQEAVAFSTMQSERNHVPSSGYKLKVTIRPMGINTCQIPQSTCALNRTLCQKVLI